MGTGMGSDILLRSAGHMSHEFDVLFSADDARFGVATLFEAREPPEIREVAALLGFDRLHGTIPAFQKLALTIRLLDQRKSAPVTSQPRIALNEFLFRQPQKTSQLFDFQFIYPDVAGPPATSGAALAFIENWHALESKWAPANVNKQTSKQRSAKPDARD